MGKRKESASDKTTDIRREEMIFLLFSTGLIGQDVDHCPDCKYCPVHLHIISSLVIIANRHFYYQASISLIRQLNVCIRKKNFNIFWSLW